MIQVTITFYSYFKGLAGAEHAVEHLREGSTLGELLHQLMTRLPALAPMRRSMLTAVGVDYQDESYVLKDRDEVALFPPVQGG